MRLSGRISRHKRQLLLLVVICAISLLALFILLMRPSKSQTSLLKKFIDEDYSVQEELLRIVMLHGDTGERSKGARSEQNTDEFIQPAAEGVQACRIPKLEINGSEVAKFFFDPEPLDCDKTNEQNWAYVDEYRCFQISVEAIKRHGEIECAVSFLHRLDDNNLKVDKVVPIRPGDLITASDYAKVSCSAKDGAVWKNLLWTLVPNSARVEELAKVKRPTDWSGLDVYFIGFDSLSQMSFRRKLPLTVKFVEEELGAVVLDGYNIVGDGTPQAFIPILTGQTEEELPLTRKRFNNANFVDVVYPFVWRNFSDAGYVTLYAEDAASVGTFTYRLKGFKNQPTDHYTRTFFQKAESMLTSMNCLGSIPLHKEWFRYMGEFMLRYNKSTPKFLLAFHSLLSHDNINLVQVADADTAEHLRKLHKSGAFDNALVIVMADHGHRFAQFRGTHQGQLEERLPFFAISLPKRFRESERGKVAWKNLKENKGRLTTPFDIHATLLDVLHWPTEDKLKTPGKTSRRSLSLFAPIPLSRTCAQAGIELHWCTCLNWESAMESDEQLNVTYMLAKAIVQTLNSFTKPERKLCARLRLMEASPSSSHSDFVFSMPFAVRKQLSSILDPGNTWETLAAVMPDINNEDVEACRRARDPESPTEILLTIWGSKGNKVIQLYNLLARTRLVRAMEVIHHLVDPKYHQWEKECVRSRAAIRSATPNGSSESLRNQGHVSIAARLSEQQSCQNASLVSSKPPQNLSNATSAASATSEPSGLFTGLQNTPLVRYEEILVATDNFAAENILGRGGYGVVYKGSWKHTQVAVKRIQAKNDSGIEHEKERLRQSLQELRTLAKYRHDNILPLYGYSLDGPEPCLVYQYMANGSLEDRILCRKGTPPLTWTQKRNIAEGSARGLHFLHSIARAPIIHGDVKSANILLDKYLEPKLGDFGLSRDGQVETGPGEKTPLIASHIKGTLAYLPPEFITSKILTTKLDVYSFGVVLLEIGTALRAYVDSREPHSLVDYVLHVQARIGKDPKKMIEALADRRYPPIDQVDSKCFLQFMRLGFQCSQKDRDLRPTFGTIVDELAD
uniref:non-specific serine/threonine protein kinase n=2 Tax=Ascaris TaxID=6251 RepID=F1KSG8_ASCSU